MMTFLIRALLKLCIFIAVVAMGIFMIQDALIQAFLHNPVLNSMIFSIFGVGLCLNFFNLFRIYKEQRWLLLYDKGQERFPGVKSPTILRPFSIILTESQSHFFAPTIIRSLLESIDARLDTMRDLSRYIIGLLIFMGLLGTFWGLSHTIGAIAGVISGIDLGGGDVQNAFATLKQGLQSPLSGMGTAFSCSMFGLAGSLIVGFMDLQIARLITEFYHGLEDRLTSLTKLSPTAEGESVTHSGPAYLQSLLEQTAETMSQLNHVMRKGEDNRTSVMKSIQSVGDRLTIMTEQMITQQQILKKITETQIQLQEALHQFHKIQQSSPTDEALRQHLRSMDGTLLKLLEESIEGRNRGIHELRNEIRLVARTISALADGQEVAA